MKTCTTLLRTSLSSFKCSSLHSTPPTLSASAIPPSFFLSSPLRASSKTYSLPQQPSSLQPLHIKNQPLSQNPITIEPHEDQSIDTVEHLLAHADDVPRLMKMERKNSLDDSSKWFPYVDRFKCHNTYVTSGEILEAVGPCISDVRKERFRNVISSRSYSVCLVVEGLSDFGNVSAAFRSADALGFQSVHVVSCDSSKRYIENRHVSMGTEKWLDIELWDSTKECFEVLKSRGYRIATTHLGEDTVSIYDLDWSCPTAILVGNESSAITGADGPDRIFVGGLPYYFTEEQIKELLQSFGPIRAFDLVRDKDTGNSKGYGFCFYQDPAVTDIACASLNGLKMGDKTLTVRRATVCAQSKTEQDHIFAQAQQHIAIQKIALEAGGLNISGLEGAALTKLNENATKVLCLTEAVTADQLRDDKEYGEILEDMRDECSKFGTLINVVIPRPNGSDDEASPGVGKVFLEYSDTSGSLAAKNALNGRKFGGSVVSAFYYPEEKYHSMEYDG